MGPTRRLGAQPALSQEVRQQLHEPGAHGLFRNSVFVTLGQGSVALLFLTYILAARILGDEGFGDFSLGLSIATILLMIPAWGSNRYTAIVAARAPERTSEILATHLGLTLPLSLLYLPALGLAATLVSDELEVMWVAIFLGLDLVVREFANVLRLLFRVHGQFPLEPLTAFAERGTIVVLTVLILLFSPDAMHLAAGFAVGRTLGVLVTIAAYRRRIGPISVRFDVDSMMEFVKAGTPIALRRGISLVTFRVDMLFLGAMRPVREVGWYGSIYTIMDGVLMLPQAINGGFGPTLSANFVAGRHEVITRLYQRGFKYLVVIGLFLSAFLAALARPIVEIVFGSPYTPGAPALAILAASVVLLFVRSLATEVLDNVDLRTTSLQIFAAGLLLNVGLNFVWVPRYGILGAAASTVATEFLLMIGMIRALNRAGYPALPFSQILPILGAMVAPAIVLFWLSDSPFLAALLGALSYAASLMLFRVWDEKDRDVFRGIWEFVRRQVGRSS